MEKRFDYDAYVKLAEKLKADHSPEARDDLAALNDAMTSFRAYVDEVCAGEQRMKLSADGNSCETFEDYDRRRHNAHENAIVSVRLVNRLAGFYGISPLFIGDDNERLQVAAFCQDVTNELFNNRFL